MVGPNVKRGQKIQLAVFGINGPISNAPTNSIFMRSAKLSFYREVAGPVSIMPSEVNVEVTQLDPAIDAIVPQNPKIYKLTDGFQVTEGPIWVRDGGYLIFSDPNANTMYRYTPEPISAPGNLSVFRQTTGYSGADIAEYRQSGSNGLAFDPPGRSPSMSTAIIGQIARTKPARERRVSHVLAADHQGKRLNSTNDLVYRSDGTLFFTNPPFGLPKFFDDPLKQLPYSAVFSIHKGKLQVVGTDLNGPMGRVFSGPEVPVRDQLGRQKEGHHALRSATRRDAEERCARQLSSPFAKPARFRTILFSRSWFP